MGSGVPTSFKNLGATAPKSRSGGALGCLGEVLEHLGGVLERPDGVLGASWGILDRPGSVLGAFWVRPGCVFGCLGGLFARLVGVL